MNFRGGLQRKYKKGKNLYICNDLLFEGGRLNTFMPIHMDKKMVYDDTIRSDMCRDTKNFGEARGNL